MLNSVDFSGRPFHFIGIGGIGMSALAYVLAKRRLPVSGSDIRLNHITQRLQDLGAHIFWSQDATNLEFFRQAESSKSDALPAAVVAIAANGKNGGGAKETRSTTSKVSSSTDTALLPQVICSTAINPANAEYRAALELGCPIFHRSDLLAALIQDYQSISVAGTHGKTTTSSMIGHLLLETGLDPTIVVGGEVKAWEGNARLGEGPYLVAEADESDGSLVKFSSQIGIITNIELDHPDHYSTLDEVISTFKTFASHCKTLIGCIDCATVRDALQPAITYSLHRESGADYTVDCVTYQANGTKAQVWERGELLGELSLKLLGQHNLSNALAAVAVGRLLNLGFAQIAPAIATFEGARRRFEYRGEYNEVLFVDDYAHHPSEIRATLAAAHLQATELPTAHQRRVVAVFQPHRYSRTQTFLAEFAESFQDADVVVVTDIYAAGEAQPDNLTGQQVVDAIAAHHAHVVFQPSLAAVQSFLEQTLQPRDLALFLGAGNLNQIIPELMAFQERAAKSISQERCDQTSF
ncbi:UDP-N-acetylmuramate--L-alanine ligase [Trichocoleus desertorum AS-A10]|uniref:UDP-N-acetylmuramate--L-alanine ligase n=1 Tax=Trichocoleus desertorum TaxID=1481672 RepID=UPI00329846C1